MANPAGEPSSKSETVDSLHDAARAGNRELAEKLLANGAAVNATDVHGSSPLLEVVHNVWGKPAVALIELLGANGANPDLADNDACTPLICAAAEEDLDAVITLIALGADVSLKDNEGESALDCAIANDATDLIAVLKAAASKPK